MEETESGAIPINSEILEQFKHDEFAENGGMASEGSSAIEGLNEAASWLLRTVDKLAREKDERLGTDEQAIQQFSELSVLVAKRNISEDVLRNSPEIFLGTITAGILIEKMMVLSTIKKEQAAPSHSDESENSEDNE